MTNKLAVKHKNSLVSKESKSLQEGNKSKDYGQRLNTRIFRIFLIVSCCIFLFYWIIFCPLAWSVFYEYVDAEDWPLFWPTLFWLVAFLVWILIMIMLILLWACVRNRYKTDPKIKSYGSGKSEGPTPFSSATYNYPGNIPSMDMNTGKNYNSNSHPHKKQVEIAKSDDKETGNRKPNRERKSRNELAPLVIHRRMSGNDIENTGTVNVENKSKENEDDALLEPIKEFDKVNRSSLKDYLKLVTLTPTEENPAINKSPKTPLTPRELFFIDLIKEADRVESAKGTDRKSQFFLNDLPSPTAKTTDKRDNIPSNGKELSLEPKSERPKSEANYFIADVESPTEKKTEVFLEINPDPKSSGTDEQVKEWSVDLSKEKPALMLQSKSEDAQKKCPKDDNIFQV